eukprot:PhF_6_TR33569/c0_g1_i1/m.48980
MLRSSNTLLYVSGHARWWRRRSKLRQLPGGYSLEPQMNKRIQERKLKYPWLTSSSWTRTVDKVFDENGNMRSRSGLDFHVVHGKGDDEPLASRPDMTIDEQAKLIYGKSAWKHTPPPIPFTPLMA